VGADEVKCISALAALEGVDGQVVHQQHLNIVHQILHNPSWIMRFASDVLVMVPTKFYGAGFMGFVPFDDTKSITQYMQ
jgi:hypothetical protein